ncbi:DNA-binding transcriptional regulator AgaR [Serratia marcescens]|uniref:DNA-binding transcriptional regulator AgaR n=1 Tax=Serratia marcescens TaxID=615 RepID=A0A379ZGK8_SERMA|nr:DNA-binding transcriptional regulator AgaR [Serratia marcescens]
MRVEQLSQQFSVSSVTIRSDLRQLEKHGCAVRAYGGAMLNKQFAFDRPLQDKGRIQSRRQTRHRLRGRGAD